MEKEERTALISGMTAYLAQREDLIAAYLFGSLVDETDHPLSDVDVALLLPHNTDRASAFDISERLATLSTNTP